MSDDTLFHYTTLETLAHILKNKQIMFRPLTEMDDLQEAKGDDLQIARYIYVSSWLSEEKESIAMWKLYSNTKSGVRIELPKNPFVTYHVTPDDLKRIIKGLTVTGEGADLILPLDECYNDNYFLINQHANNVLEKVEYVEDPSIYNSEAIKVGNNEISMKTSMFGKYKNKYWEFQNEERYILKFIPVDVKRITNETNVAGIIHYNLSQPSKMKDRLFLNISNEAFKQMKVMLSPEFTDGNKIIMEALRDKFNPDLEIIGSELKDKIRLK